MVSLDRHGMPRLLAGSQLFASFPGDAREELSAHATVRTAREKDVIFEKDAPGNEMFAIVQGRVKIGAFSEDGKEVIFAILESGDFFGETALLDGKPRSATCTAIEDCQLVVIERSRFVAFLEHHPSLAIHLLALISERLRATNRQMEEVSFFPLNVRLARKLLALADEHGDVFGSRVEIAMNLSQYELGNMVAASRESVNKQLAQWVKEDLLTLSPGRIIIHSRERLQKVGKMS